MELTNVFNKVKDKDFSFVTMDSLMEELKISYSTMRRMRNEGLPHYKRGKKIYFNLNKVHEWFENNHKVM
jgi:hypothetical protein|tara:strand:- start:321 stop:530 length:210 start_codon:yes stop_codon:yes gene_type:complete